MATITKSNKDNFLLWEKVNGVLTLAELQAEGLPDRPDVETELVGGFIYSVTVSALETISLPMSNVHDSEYDFIVNFGDLTGNKSVSAYADSDREHTYAEAGTYDITIVGQFGYIRFLDSPNSIIEVKGWGTSRLGLSSFVNCTNFTTISATDSPGMFGVILTNCFANCVLSSVNASIDNWDVSTITAIQSMFSATSFNQDISSWDTGSVTNMASTFVNSSFNQDISSWDITSLVIAANMFNGGSLSTTNYDLLLVGWESQVELTGVNFHAGSTTTYTQTSVDSGTTDGTTAFKLVQSGQNFLTTVSTGDIVHNTTDDTFAKVTAIDSDTTLSINNNIMISGEDYVIQSSAAAKSRFEIIDTSNWIITDGGPV